jgi:ABC-type transport system involved in multi-copper enzyme maturation permease subunit
MMRGLLAKTIREVWLTTSLFGIALFLVLALLTYVLPRVQEGLTDIFAHLPFVKTLMTALLGTDIGDEITARAVQALLWVHPVVLTIIWAHEIVFCTRMPAGEIDRGTIDVLLGLPVSRRAVYLCESAAWLVSGVLILSMGLAGHLMTASAMPADMRPAPSRVILVLTNLFCVYVSVGGIAFLVSALSDRRGRAIAIVFSIVLASFLLNFLAQFWEPAQQLAFLSVMDYYTPATILLEGRLPTSDVSVLLITGGVAWLLGGEVLARRSICTV